MTISKVQQVTGNGATLSLNGVTSGNALFLLDSYFRSTGTGVAETVPTDTAGTFSIGNSDAPAQVGPFDIGTGIFYQAGVAAGTHTVTPQANPSHRTTLVEFSALDVSPGDVATSAKTSNGSQTSQVTGTTGTTAQADELVLISLSLGADVGAADVGFTDPVSGFTTLQKASDDATSIATFHAFKVIAATGTQAATFNWTDNEINQGSHAAIATFKAAAIVAVVQYPQQFASQLELLSEGGILNSEMTNAPAWF